MAKILTGAELAENNRSRAAQKKISEFPLEELVCRTRRHRWPELDPRKPLPKSFKARLTGDGSGTFLMTETCERNCGKFRYRLSGAGGMFQNVGRWQYGMVTGSKWVVVEMDGPEVKPADMEQALYSQLFDMVKRTAEPA